MTGREKALERRAQEACKTVSTLEILEVRTRGDQNQLDAWLVQWFGTLTMGAVA